VRVGRLGVVHAPKRLIISAVDGPAIGSDELLQFVPGQHQRQFGLIHHHATITRWYVLAVGAVLVGRSKNSFFTSIA